MPCPPTSLWPCLALCAALASPLALAQVSITALDTPVTQSFDTLAVSGTNLWSDNVTLAGWYATRTGYNAGNGSSNSGALYSFGTGTSTERALGSLASGSTGTIFYGIRLLNATGTTITRLDLSYVGEQWRNAQASPNKLAFSYQVAAPGAITGANTPATGWIPVEALDFTSPVTGGSGVALDGNALGNRTPISGPIEVSIAPGEEVWLRWADIDDTGADHGLAVDEFSVTARGGAGLPVLSIDDVSQAEGNAGTTAFRFTASLSAPSALPVSFLASTVDDSATVADSDYQPLTLAPFSIPAGDSSVEVTVLVNGDTTNEPNERFFVDLSAILGATAGDVRGAGTILNDDGDTPIDVTLDSPSLAEGDVGNRTLNFTVSLSAPAPTGGVSFDLATEPGTATAGQDYVSRSETGLSIPAGMSSLVFGVQLIGDIVHEPDESFTVRISNVSGHMGGTVTPTGTGTIVNDDPVPLSIAQLQGTGLASPVAGSVRSTFGNVVTAVMGNQFTMQMPIGDGDPMTSDAILVFTGGAPTVAVGDLVDVKGNLVEFSGMTEFNAVGLVVIRTGTAPLPAPLRLDATRPSPDPEAPTCVGGSSTIPPTATAKEKNFECLEFMRVDTETGVINSPNQAFGTDPIAENWFTTDGRRSRREPGIDPRFVGEPGLPAGLARWDGNPEMFEIDIDRLGLPNDVLVPGTRIRATGVIGFDFGEYEFWPASHEIVGTAPVLPRPAPSALPGELAIGSFNVENLFDTVDDPLTDDTVLTPAQLELKLGKISAYIRQVLGAPPILGLIEVENQAVLDLLAARLKADDPSIDYQGFLIEGNDPRGIDVAFLVRDTAGVTIDNRRVTALRRLQTTTQCGGTPPCLLHDRPSLLLEADVAAGSGPAQPVAVIVNHFRSLSGIDNQADLANANRIRRKRLEQAVAIAEETQAYQSANPDTPLILLGDMNGFEFTDGYADVVGILRGDANVASDGVPRDTQYEIQDLYPGIPGNIVTPTLAEAMDVLPEDERYSFLFGCAASAGCFAQALDHTLLNRAAVLRYSRFGFGRGNADARRALADTPLSPLRSSDHDGTVVVLKWANDLFGNGFEATPPLR